jgi:hypothetical protein
MPKQVELVKGTAFELDPNKQYLICVNNFFLSKENCEDLVSELHRIGIHQTVCLVTKGNPTDTITIIEQKDDQGK